MSNVLSPYRQAQIRTFCNYALFGFANVTQAGKYALQVLSIAGDGSTERRAILRELWAYHQRIASGEIPFILLCGVGLCIVTGCTPIK